MSSEPLRAPARAHPVARRRAPRAFVRYAPSALLFAVLVGVWEVSVRLFDVPEYLLPAPSAVASDFAEERSLLASNTWTTVVEVVVGFAIALAAGVLFAVVLHLSPTLRRVVYPLLVGSQTIPTVVLAPILVILLGFGYGPKLAIVGLICFFPIVVNGVDGLRSVDEELVRLMRTLHASRWAIFRRVEFPSALPLIFSGTRVAAVYAAIGAVFGEWSGSTSGLGYVMLQSTPSLETARVIAAVVILSAISLTLFLLVSLAERLLVPWAPTRDVPA